MEIFCEDHKLNISPSYLRPGFAFGGSCLPKDLRALQSMARASGVDVPLLSSTLVSNEIIVRALVDRVLETGYRRVAILGLSFKMNTDDCARAPTSGSPNASSARVSRSASTTRSSTRPSSSAPTSSTSRASWRTSAGSSWTGPSSPSRTRRSSS